METKFKENTFNQEPDKQILREKKMVKKIIPERKKNDPSHVYYHSPKKIFNSKYIQQKIILLEIEN